jgi:FkbM family methyltransferase
MPGGRKWIGWLMLHSPTRLHSLRDFPLIGSFIHLLSHRILPSDERVWARIEAGPAAGIWLELNPRVGQNYFRGETEIVIQDVLARRLRSGMVFYDLGANIGLFTLLGARLVGPKGKVISFEPDAQTAARLRRNIQRNKFANVTVMEAGVWSKSGYMNFVTSDLSSPDHGLSRFVAGETNGTGTPTQSVALDDLIGRTPPPDAIKCDVEGAEVEVFRGAEKLLREHEPWIICELHSASNDFALRHFLGRFGYRFESLDANHMLAWPRGRVLNYET